jgi:8-oxo-dGTP pyrophosphatase MutT (NUDIX family)
MPELLSESHKFRLWKQNILKNGLQIHKIDEVHTRHRHNGEVLFSLLLVDATTPEGDKIPPVCFLKGEVVSVLLCLIDRESREKHLLLVHQRRICNGDLIYEHTAGMVDKGEAPLEVAVREVEEETGLSIRPDQLHRLNAEPYFPSTGTSDEAIYFYYCELEMSREKIFSYHGNAQGAAHEHERIITHVTSIPEAARLIRNGIGMLNLFMYLVAVQDWESLREISDGALGAMKG